MVMTSSKSVKIGYCHNFRTNYPLIMIDPSFFIFLDALLNEIQSCLESEKCWRQQFLTIKFLMTSWWRHVTSWRHRSDFLFWIISLIDILLLFKFQVNWIIFSQDMMISFFAILYRIFADFATPVRQNRYNFSPDHRNVPIFCGNMQN